MSLIRAVSSAFILALLPLGQVLADGAPPVSGSVQNFIVFDEPVPAPEESFVAEDGRAWTFEDLRGQVVLVNFWATWCGPCIRELPSIERLQAELGGDAFTVAIVSQDRAGWPQINKFLKKLKVSSPLSFLDENLKLSRAMQVRGLPVTAIIDADGNEVGRVAGAAEWDTPEAFELVRFYIEQALASS